MELICYIIILVYHLILKEKAQEKGSHYLKTTKRHKFENYKEFIKEIIDSGSGISLSDIRDMLNEKEEFVFNNSEIKIFLISAFTDEI